MKRRMQRRKKGTRDTTRRWWWRWRVKETEERGKEREIYSEEKASKFIPLKEKESKECEKMFRSWKRRRRQEGDLLQRDIKRKMGRNLSWKLGGGICSSTIRRCRRSLCSRGRERKDMLMTIVKMNGSRKEKTRRRRLFQGKERAIKSNAQEGQQRKRVISLSSLSYFFMIIRWTWISYEMSGDERLRRRNIQRSRLLITYYIPQDSSQRQVDEFSNWNLSWVSLLPWLVFPFYWFLCRL